MVLLIMVLMFGVAAFSFQGVTEADTLRKPAGELQRMAREAVRRAGLYERPQFILFEKTGFVIHYRNDASAVANAESNTVWQRRVEVPDKMTLKLRRWGAKGWQPAAGQRWVVLPSGLCEPLAVRMEMGGSSIELQFNPLTGGVAEETLNIAAP